MLWCFILGFLHQRRWYSFILFPNLQCSVFVNTEEANFEILLLENKQTLANTTHIMVTGQRGDGEQYRISRQQWWMGIYPIGCSLIPDENHPFNKNPLHGFRPKNLEVTIMSALCTGMALWYCLVLPSLLRSLQPLMAAHNLDSSPIFVVNIGEDPQNCLLMNIFTDKQILMPFHKSVPTVS